MASTSGTATTSNLLNYQGVVVQLKPKETPLMTMLMSDNKLEATGSRYVNMSQELQLDTPSQPSRSEDAAKTAPVAKTFATTPQINEKQIFDATVSVTNRKLADTHMSGNVDASVSSPIESAMSTQIQRNLGDQKLKMEYSIINGVYQTDGGSSGTASQMKGISTAITTNLVNASGALSTTLMDQVSQKVAESEQPNNLLLMAAPNQIVRLNNLYSNAIESITVGGTQIRQLYLATGIYTIMINNQVNTDEILLLNYDRLSLTYTPHNGNFIDVSPLGRNGAADEEYIYSDFCVNYTHEVFHAKIDGLTV